jgi:hypothetical protein
MPDNTQSSSLIPDDLPPNIKKGDCVLFLGADLPLDYEGAPPSRPELADLLAERYDLPPGRPWPETVQAYLNRGGSRETLIDLLQDWLGGSDAAPGPPHEAVAQTGFRGVVTAWIDQRLEQALAAAGYRVTRVVRGRQSLVTKEGEPEIFVIKLYGCLSDPASLVLTPCEHDKLAIRLNRDLEMASGFCHSRPPLFVGFDPLHSANRRLYVRVSINLDDEDRRVFVTWPAAPEKIRAAWSELNADVILAETTPLLEYLVTRLPDVVTDVKGPIRVHRPPYKFLDYYGPQDVDIFCGRDTESQIVARQILSHRLLTLFGPSGAGKTSLLLAGALPRLVKEKYASVYVRALDDPLPAVRRAVAARAGRTDWQVGDDLRAFLSTTLRAGIPATPSPAPSGLTADHRAHLRRILTQRFSAEELHNLCADLNVDAENLPAMTKAGLARELIQYLDRREQLARLIEVGRQVRPDVDWTGLHLGDAPTDPIPQPPVDRLVVVLDQFEELFLRVGSRQRATFFAEVAAALDRPEPDVRFVFSLREDYLARLDEARDVLPDVFVNPFRLTPLDRSNARVAVTEPAARAKVKVEPALVDALVGGEGRGSKEREVGALVEEDGRVPPAALQIVLDYLYRAALPPGHDPAAAPPEGVGLTLDAYRAVHHEQRREGEEARILTGAEAILAGYVREGLARLADLKLEDDETSLGADPELGEAILKVMVTSEGTKAVLTHDEILNRLDEAGAAQYSDPADEALVKSTRLGLQRVRLLRGFERDGQALYELAHDHLAAEIATWITEEEMAARLVHELLGRAMDDWRGAGLLIRPEVLALIHERREDLRHLNAEELELLFRSALAAGTEVAYWFDRACEGGVTVDGIAREGLESESFRTRAAAVEALAGLGDTFVDPIVDRLGDDYPQVRMAAIRALDRLRPDGAWREKLVYECYVPAGPFLMGSEDGDSDEKPVHEVTLEAYYIGRYPVTNADYKRYKDDVGQPFQIPEGKADHPVVQVSWYDARDYAAWAGMRLPTEAEWEKAASWEVASHNDDVGATHASPHGRKRVYPWGDQFDKNKCNTSKSGIGTTTPVGAYSLEGDSPYGCADMAGNVWEWCSSLYKDYPYRADDGREDLQDSGPRVQRGGSFNDLAWYARAARRDGHFPNSRHRDCGVRVAAPFSPRSVL